jgi:hypothetical protein
MGRGARSDTQQVAPIRADPIRDALRRRRAEHTPSWLQATVSLPNGMEGLSDAQRKVRLDGFHPDTIGEVLGGSGRTVTMSPDGGYVTVALDNGWMVCGGWRQGDAGPSHHASGHCDGGARTVEVAVRDDTGRMVCLKPNDQILAVQSQADVKGLIRAAEQGRVVDFGEPDIGAAGSVPDYSTFA